MASRYYDQDRDRQGRFTRDRRPANQWSSRRYDESNAQFQEPSDRHGDVYHDQYGDAYQDRYRDQYADEYNDDQSDSRYRDRDDRGRFVSDDDRSEGRWCERRSDRMERDQYGRFVAHDDRHPYRHDDRYDDDQRDQRGWYGDPQGHFRSAERDWSERYGAGHRQARDDDYRQSSGRSREPQHRGWYGDSRGHAQAARRGWQHRRD
jgi:hypothetical protein